MAQVARIEPAIGIDRLGRGLGLAVIARHHLGTFRQHPPPLAPTQGHAALRIDHLDGGAGQGSAGAAAPVGPPAATAEHRAGFGEAIAHQQLDADRLKEAIHMGGQGAAAADSRAQTASGQLLPHLGPEQLGSQAMARPAGQGQQSAGQPGQGGLREQALVLGLAPVAAMEAAQAQGRSQQAPPSRGHGCKRLLKAGQQGLPQARHADHVVGAHPLEVGLEMLDAGVALAAAAGEQEVFGGAFVGMPDRQHAQHPIAGIGGHGDAKGGELVQEVGVAEGHALGFPRGAGGVQQGGQSLRAPGGRGRQRGGYPQLHQGVPAQAGDRQGPSRRADPLQQHHKLQARQLAELGRELLQQGRRFHHQANGTGIPQDVTEFRQGGATAPHGIGGAGAHQALVSQEPAGAVFSKQGHHIPRHHAQGSEACGGSKDGAVEGLKAPLLRGLGVGGVQGQGLTMATRQLGPELLQGAKAAPVGALG